MTDLLELALDDLVPRFEDAQGDWANVVARTGRTRLGLRRHPRRTVSVALAVALVVVLATPAFGLQGYVLHLLGRKNVSFSGSPSAPNVVKKQFLDMPVGAPPRWNTPVRAAQARVVGTFSLAGHPRKLWVAPTTRGGFCYTFEQSFGGCRLTRAQRGAGTKAQLGVTWQAAAANGAVVTRVGGDVTASAAAKLTASYADGTSADIPFIWVSAPIAAGFYSYDIPTAHWRKPARLTRLQLSAADGRVIATQEFPSIRHPFPRVRIGARGGAPRAGTPKTRTLPTKPEVAPSAPIQTTEADGFRVTVGHNGAVQFSQTGETPILRKLRGESAGFGCFRLTREFGIFSTRGLSQGGRFAARVGFTLYGVGTPVDACEVQASIGRAWPDSLHNRAAAELPLTARGRAFFADRAAARDLALFVRSRRMHQLRKEPARAARADIVERYGRQLANSAIRLEVVDPRTLRLSERSATGRTFAVTIRDGRIAAQNLKPYAFVF